MQIKDKQGNILCDSKDYTYNVILRIDKKDNEPIIFYRELERRNPLNSILTCFIGCHSEACLDFYYNDTRPAKTEKEKAQCQYLLDILFSKEEKYKIYQQLNWRN